MTELKPDADGRLVLDVNDGAVMKRLATAAPFREVEITTEPLYDETREAPLEPVYAMPHPELLGVDLTIRVRMMTGTTDDGVLYRMVEEPPAPAVWQIIERALAESHVNAARSLTPLYRSRLASEIADALRKAGRA